MSFYSVFFALKQYFLQTYYHVEQVEDYPTNIPI